MDELKRVLPKRIDPRFAIPEYAPTAEKKQTNEPVHEDSADLRKTIGGDATQHAGGAGKVEGAKSIVETSALQKKRAPASIDTALEGELKALAGGFIHKLPNEALYETMALLAAKPGLTKDIARLAILHVMEKIDAGKMKDVLEGALKVAGVPGALPAMGTEIAAWIPKIAARVDGGNDKGVWIHYRALSDFIVRSPEVVDSIPKKELETLVRLFAHDASRPIVNTGNQTSTIQKMISAATVIEKRTGVDCAPLLASATKLAFGDFVHQDNEPLDNAKKYIAYYMTRSVCGAAAELGKPVSAELIGTMVEQYRQYVAMKLLQSEWLEAWRDLRGVVPLALAFPDKEQSAKWMERLNDTNERAYALLLERRPESKDYWAQQKAHWIDEAMANIAPKPYVSPKDERKLGAHEPTGPADRKEALKLLTAQNARKGFTEAGGDQAVLALVDRDRGVRVIAEKAWRELLNKQGLGADKIRSIVLDAGLHLRIMREAEGKLGKEATKATDAFFALVEEAVRKHPKRWTEVYRGCHANFYPPPELAGGLLAPMIAQQRKSATAAAAKPDNYPSVYRTTSDWVHFLELTLENTNAKVDQASAKRLSRTFEGMIAESKKNLEYFLT